MNKKNSLLLIIVLLFASLTKAQIGVDKKYDCATISHLTFPERMNKYPFNKSTRIQIISFTSDTLTRVPYKNKKLDWEQTKDSITLTKSQVDSLSNILFNVGCKADTVTFGINYAVGVDIAILFYNSQNQLADFVLICFECMNFSISTEKNRRELGKPCNQKIEIIKSFIKTTTLKL
jgi:hypothetical protein